MLPHAGRIVGDAPLSNSGGAFRALIPYADAVLGAIGCTVTQRFARGFTRTNCAWCCTAMPQTLLCMYRFSFRFQFGSAAALLLGWPRHEVLRLEDI